MRSEGPRQECLLADYLELGKIKRHTHIQSYLLPLFLPFSFNSHTEEIGVLRGVILRILFGVKRNCLRRGKAEERRTGEREPFTLSKLKTENQIFEKKKSTGE